MLAQLLNRPRAYVTSALSCLLFATAVQGHSFAQTPAPASAPAKSNQLGTVKAVSAASLTLTTAAGAEVQVSVAPGVPVLQLPPGSTDLKTAIPAKLDDVSVGDRVLVTGRSGDPAAGLAATRVVLMKSGDIAARNATEQQAWQRGFGGLVRSVDGDTITIVSGTRVLKIETSSKTDFKQYASDSVAFSDVKPGSLASIHPGDQVRARGQLAEDRLSMTADAIVSGSFENLSGSVASIDLAAQSLTLKDLATKKTVTVLLTQKSDLRNLTPQAEASFAARNTAGSSAPGGSVSAPAAAGKPPSAQAPASGTGSASSSPNAGGGRSRNAGLDLSQMLAHLPTQTLSDLKPGQAVMIVASQGGAGNPTVVTLLSGVEQILSATPTGQQPVTLSPWSLGEPGGGGGDGAR